MYQEGILHARIKTHSSETLIFVGVQKKENLKGSEQKTIKHIISIWIWLSHASESTLLIVF